MSAGARVAAFAALLAVVFAAAALAGSKLDPKVESTDAHEEDATMDTHATTSPQAGSNAYATDTHAADEAAAPSTLPGLAVAEGGLRLIPAQTELPAGSSESFRFRIVDDEGETVDAFDVEHERRMHLIVVRRDFTNFQHLHPRQLADGSWEVELELAAAGTYRVFADFESEGRALTLATDLFAAGEFRPEALPAPSNLADAGDGYRVSLDSPDIEAGSTAPLRFTVTRDGEPVSSVEPYLGADGHLVALREHDQAFLHTHPQGEPGGGGPIAFDVEYPTAGRYRIYLQFRDGGEVHTAAFTQEVGDEHDEDESR